MMKTRIFNKKTAGFAAATMLLFACHYLLFAQGNEPENKVILGQVGESLSEIWPEKSCASFVTRHLGYPLVSLACRQGYSKRNRAQFLDAIFKRGFILKNETWRLSPGSGFYLYKTEYPISSGKFVFFKLYFRNATYLYPKTPYSDGHVAVFVQDLYRMKDLLRWQTLGIPLSYGVITHRKESREIADKIRVYNQELWMSLSLEPHKMSPLLGKVLTLKAVLDEEKRRTFLDEAFDELGTVKGVSNRMGSLFTRNVYGMRTLFNALKERKVNYFLDTLTTSKSVAYQTAEVMSMNSFKRDFILDHKNNTADIANNWNLAMKSMRDKGYTIVLVHAKNYKSFQFLKEKSRLKRSKRLHFVTVSQVPVESR